MFEIVEEFQFVASHKMMHPDGSSSNVHGHNWHLKVFAQTPRLDMTGMTRSYLDLRKIIQLELDHYDHTYLNDLEEFAGQNPTAEVIAAEMFHVFSEKVNTADFKICAIEIWEAEKRRVKYFQDVWREKK